MILLAVTIVSLFLLRLCYTVLILFFVSFVVNVVFPFFIVYRVSLAFVVKGSIFIAHTELSDSWCEYPQVLTH